MLLLLQLALLILLVFYLLFSFGDDGYEPGNEERRNEDLDHSFTAPQRYRPSNGLRTYNQRLFPTQLYGGLESRQTRLYKTIDLVGSSAVGIEDAVERALKRASETVRQMRWFQVTEVRGAVEGDHVGHWQVSVKVGFTLED
ncbi:MAG: dodecin [Planctomycetota bacterium]|jgi:flavin-binding protein dodecin